MKKTSFLLSSERAGKLLNLSNEGPVNVTIGMTKTKSGRLISIEYDERDELYVEWLIARAEED